VTYERLVNADKEPPELADGPPYLRLPAVLAAQPDHQAERQNLRLLFAFAIGGSTGNESVEATRLVEDGFMYIVDHWGVVLQDRRTLGNRRAHRVEDGSRPGKRRPQSRA